MKYLKQKGNKKTATLGLVLVPVAILAIALVVFSILPKSNAVNIEGSIEISTSPYFSLVNGTVEQVLVATGEAVKAGDTLAVIDSKGIDNEIKQLKEMLIIKEAKLSELTGEPKVGAIDAARKAAIQQVNVCREQEFAAQRNLTNAKKDLELQSQLFSANIISREELNKYKIAVEECASALSIATAQVAAAESHVETIAYPEKNANEIEAARADIKLTQLQIEKLESGKEDYVIQALHDGLVVSCNIDPGATVITGQSIFELSDEERNFVFYLPEEYIHAIQFGDEIALYPFNGKETIGTGEICFIDWKAIYTPRDFESSVNKNKRSIKIKALVQSEQKLGVGETLVTRIENEN